MKKNLLCLLAALFFVPISVLAVDQNSVSDPSLPVPEIVTSSTDNASSDEKIPDTIQVANPLPNDPQKEVMTTQLKQMNEITVALSQTVNDLNAKMNGLQSDFNRVQSQNSRFHHQIKLIMYSLFALTLLAVLTAGWGVAKGRRQALPALKKKDETQQSSQSEYDFMSSSEGIPAKLDLARAYIAMEDYDTARETLSEIINEGNSEYHPEAKSLLNKIKNQTA